MSTTETISNPEDPIRWPSNQANRSVEIDYVSMPGMGGGYEGSDYLYLYLTDEEGTCMSNIVAWPVSFK
jgi:hypothetical protein